MFIIKLTEVVLVAYPSPFVVNRGIPSSFKGSDGKIVFSLEAELSRSMRINKKSSTTINFVAKPDPNTLPGLMVSTEFIMLSFFVSQKLS